MNLESAAFAALGFLFGSLPTAYLYCQWKYQTDIRTLGSGNPGATNVFRNFGSKAGWTVLSIDAVKGFLPVFFHLFFLSQITWPPSEPALTVFLTVTTSVAGHIFSPFLRFKGGKGVATGAGAMLAALPFCFLPALLVWVVVLKIFRYMSLASLTAAYTFFVLAGFQYRQSHTTYVSLFLCLVLTYTHRSNIIRLIRGQESKFSFSKQS